jgi:hypothetical protein
MKLSDLIRSGHWPTLLVAFLYFDFKFHGLDGTWAPWWFLPRQLARIFERAQRIVRPGITDFRGTLFPRDP